MLLRICGAVLPLLLYHLNVSAQDTAILKIPSNFASKEQQRMRCIETSLTRETEKYVSRLDRQEQTMFKKLQRVDSAGAAELFNNVSARYHDLSALSIVSGSNKQAFAGRYYAFTDSLQGTLKFLTSGPFGTSITKANLTRLAAASGELDALQAKLHVADQLKGYIQERKQLIAQYLQQHNVASKIIGKRYQSFKEDAFYYSQQIHTLKQTLNDPDRLQREILTILSKLPAWKSFMRQNSQLTGLFNLPSGDAQLADLSGLQTKDAVSALINQQISTAGPSGAQTLRSNIQAAENQLGGYKERLNNVGGADAEIPNFKPNQQKTKSFWHRLEYGANFQTTRNSYYFPTTSDIGGLLGYKINDNSTMGIGVSYKVGWGNGIQHISFSSQGVGLRSFLDLKLKRTWFASGGFEYNYSTPFRDFQSLAALERWTKSGLVGISKTISVKTRVFKKTKMSVLWDFLSYQAIPKTQPIIFRIGYTF